MAKAALQRDRWTLSFDSRLESLVEKAARRRGVRPARLLEDIVRKQFGSYGHGDIQDSADYVAALRKGSRGKTDQVFLAELRTWQRSQSS